MEQYLIRRLNFSFSLLIHITGKIFLGTSTGLVTYTMGLMMMGTGSKKIMMQIIMECRMLERKT